MDDCNISVSDSYNGSEELRLNLSSKEPLNLEIWLTLASKAVFKILSIPCRTNTFFTFYGISINNQGAYTIFTIIFLQLCYGMQVSFCFIAIAHNISYYSFTSGNLICQISLSCFLSEFVDTIWSTIRMQVNFSYLPPGWVVICMSCRKTKQKH